MKGKLLFLFGMIIFIAFIWITTSIGMQSSFKKENKILFENNNFYSVYENNIELLQKM